MKTRYVVLVFFSLLFVYSCCNKDDDNNNEPEQVEFTSTNYIYEGDLRKYFLETRNTELQAQIDVWELVTDNDPTYEAVQISILAANTEMGNNTEESNSILVPGDQFFIINPTFPPIPVPLPCLCLILYNTNDHLVFQSSNDTGGVTITSVADQTTLVSTNANTQINTILNTDNLGRYQSFETLLNGFTGEAVIEVTTDNGSYSILANFQNLE